MALCLFVVGSLANVNMQLEQSQPFPLKKMLQKFIILCVYDRLIIIGQNVPKKLHEEF